MRVLAATHSLGTNGAAVCLCRLLLALRAAGARADVVCNGATTLAPLLQAQGVRVLQETHTGLYDVALVNTLLDHRWVQALAPDLPVVFWVHEGSTARDGLMATVTEWQQAFELSARLVFVNSQQSERVFHSLLGGVERHRVLHVAPAVRIAPQDRGAPREHRLARHIVSVSSVYPRKRPADVVAAVAALGMADVRCTLVGNFDHVALNGEAMQRTLAHHPDTFCLAGEVVDPADLVEHLRAADVFCSASADESFPMAPVEAASMGLPLALSDLPCYHGVWRHGVHALLAPVGAVDCIAWNLRALTQDPALAARLAHAAQQVAERYTLERFVQGMVTALTQALQDPAPRPLKP